MRTRHSPKAHPHGLSGWRNRPLLFFAGVLVLLVGGGPAAFGARLSVGAESGAAECFGRRPTIVGTRSADKLHGTRGADVIWAGGGNDVISGLGYGDQACGGDGNDTIRQSTGWGVDMDGGRGADRLVSLDTRYMVGGPGDDRLVVEGTAFQLFGGSGADVFRLSATAQRASLQERPCVSYRRAGQGVTVDLAAGRASGEGRDQLLGVHCVEGSRYSDVLSGSPLADYFEGVGGRDVIDTGRGPDLVFGGVSADVIDLGRGDDYAYGYGGRDRMYGRQGNDVLIGVQAGDYLYGGPGDDRLHAGLFCDPASSYGLGSVDEAPNVLHGGDGSDYLTGDLGDDFLDGGPGDDRGTGGAEGDGVDVIQSVETPTDC